MTTDNNYVTVRNSLAEYNLQVYGFLHIAVMPFACMRYKCRKSLYQLMFSLFFI
jgi:hypothetical protein